MSVRVIQRTLFMKCWSNVGVSVCRKFSSISAYSPSKTLFEYKQCFEFKTRWPSNLLPMSNYYNSNRMKGSTANCQKSEENPVEVKKRLPRKKRFILESETVSSNIWSVKAIATAEGYNLESLLAGLNEQQLYIPHNISTSTSSLPDVIHAIAKYEVESERREIFFFREGTVVMWNVSELERGNILQFLKKYQENSYSEKIVELESEMMNYLYADNGTGSHIKDGNFLLAKDATSLDKYTFSNAMAQSVRLGIWEATLDEYIDSIEFVTEDLKTGRKIKLSQEQVLRKQGELFALRHSINLSSDLLDTPDFYWDRDDLEILYQQVCSYFAIAKRTRVINEKLNHCVELVGILSSHLSDRHHIRLEWMVIALIMAEVLFEVLHYVDRYLA